MDEIEVYILNNQVQLDIRCWNCDGGKLTSETHSNPVFFDADGVCEHCSGTGYILTPVGESIIKLVKRHGKREL